MGTLYVVATPIGNLGDISLRALEVLKTVDVILCEDTRHTKKLLSHFEIHRPLVSYHQHSALQKAEKILSDIKAGKSAALVTDAGTPGISDPGNILVEAAYSNAIPVLCVPGPSALTAALSVSGFPTDRFVFHGFLPHKKGRQTLLKEISESKKTSVFFESTHRIEKALEQLKEYLSTDREIFIARELTKKFETHYRGNIENVSNELKKDSIKGEFVVVVRGKEKKHE